MTQPVRFGPFSPHHPIQVMWSIVITFMMGLGLLSAMATPFLLSRLPAATSNFTQIPGHQLYSVQRNAPFATLEGDRAANLYLRTDFDQDLWPGY
jgi:hypothetical protein